MFNYFKKFQTKYSFLFIMMFVEPFKYLNDSNNKNTRFKSYYKDRK